MRLVEHAALAERLLEQRHQICALGRRGCSNRLVGVQWCWFCRFAFVAPGQQASNEVAGSRQRGFNCRALTAGVGVALPLSPGHDRERQRAIVIDNFKLKGVAGLGRKGQGERDVALVDQGAVGSVGK